MKNIPSKNDINPISEDLDGIIAIEHFYGKNQEEATQLFFEHASFYAGDLLWMGIKGFVYYFPAIEPYIISDASNKDSDVIATLILVIKAVIRDKVQYIGEWCIHGIRVLSYISNNINKFDINKDIYGDLEEEIRDLLTFLRLSKRYILDN